VGRRVLRVSNGVVVWSVERKAPRASHAMCKPLWLQTHAHKQREREREIGIVLTKSHLTPLTLAALGSPAPPPAPRPCSIPLLLLDSTGEFARKGIGEVEYALLVEQQGEDDGCPEE